MKTNTFRSLPKNYLYNLVFDIGIKAGLSCFGKITLSILTFSACSLRDKMFARLVNCMSQKYDGIDKWVG